MELIGSLFLILALGVIVALFVARPFLQGSSKDSTGWELSVEQEREHVRSSLLAEHDRVLTALQELDFDYALGKVPAEGYPFQREALMKTGADVLRKLDSIAAPSTQETAEDRIEAAVAARRADAQRGSQVKEPHISEMAHSAASGGSVTAATGGPNKRGDELEDIIAMRKRERKESSGGFCPHCGKTVSKSDKFCSKCGATL